MALLTPTHKIIISILIILTLLGICLVTFFEYSQGEVQSLTDSKVVTVTGDIPHILTIQLKPESRIPPSGNDEIPVVVEIRNPSSLIPILTSNITANASGNADLGTISSITLPPGIYDVAIKGLSHLRKVYPNQNFEGPVIRTYTLLIPQLPAGDANPTADNYVNGMDISYLTLNLYGADLRADLTHDGIVNSLDYTALLRNINSYGDN